jgi:hypothetical protein
VVYAWARSAIQARRAAPVQLPEVSAAELDAHKPVGNALRGASIFLLWIPAICDLTGTTVSAPSTHPAFHASSDWLYDLLAPVSRYASLIHALDVARRRPATLRDVTRGFFPFAPQLRVPPASATVGCRASSRALFASFSFPSGYPHRRATFDLLSDMPILSRTPPAAFPTRNLPFPSE